MAAVIAAYRARRRWGYGPEFQSLDERRAAFSPAPIRHPLPDDVIVEHVDADGVEAHWLTCPEADPHRVVLYVHGGGWALGDLGSHGELASRIGREARARVLFLEYRRPPEHPFPAALHDVLTAWEWLERTAPDTRRALVGDSAGGNLSLALSCVLRDRGATPPTRIGLMSPVTDLTGSGASMSERADQDPVFDPATVRALERQYLGGADPRDPRASPHFADLTGLPPMLIQTGDAEVLLRVESRIVV